MSGIVMTIVAPKGGLQDSLVAETAERLRRAGGGTVVPDMLDAHTAADLTLPDTPAHPDVLATLRDQFQNLNGVDVFIQPAGDSRRKKLLVADMDATIVVGETLDEIAGHLGLADRIAPITARAMRGELDFAEALRERVALLRGAALETLELVRDKMMMMPGAEVLVRTMTAQGARCVLASGGFDMFTGAVAARLGFHAHFGNRLVIDPGMKATGEVLMPIVDKHRKRDILHDEAARLGISPLDAMAVGDGANDIPMLQAAGAGVAYHAKPVVEAATPYRVRHGDLTALLYMQGYRGRVFAAS